MEIDKSYTVEDYQELIIIYENYIAQLVGIDWNDLIFDLNYGKLRIEENK